MTTRYDADRAAIAALLSDQPRYRVDQVWEGMWQRGRSPEELSNVPAEVRERLADALPAALQPVTESVTDNGDTVKWLWGLHDGARVETVLMHYRDRSTVCVSTQAGCAMACSFCATGQAGFERHLTGGEIVEQVIAARRRAAADRDGRRVANVVFMGMGEPLANYDATWRAVEHLHDDLGIGARHLTISKVGLVTGIRRLAEASLPVNLAVSLHAANDALRDDLVPINRRWPLEELIRACVDYFDATHRRVSFEWALIAGVNDRPSDVDELSAIARRVRAHVNLIPLNPTPGYAVRGTSAAEVRRFRDALEDRGVNVTVRDTRGSNIDAACGQLRAGHEATPVDRPRRR
ncbi:MAG: 23S rRNA (adenine(2503)-C(2))-methyltransferase RlmN [Actinomycetes bacterium]